MQLSADPATLRRSAASGSRGTDLSGDYSGETYFTDMPARMQPIDELAFDIESLAANRDLVVSATRIRGRRLGRVLDTTGDHVLRFDPASRIIEAWGLWSSAAAPYGWGAP